MASVNKKQYKYMLDDLCSDYCSSDKKCILKEFLLSSHPSPRLLTQLKCVEKFKKILAKEKGTDVDSIEWNEAWMAWTERGLSVKFNDAYVEDCHFRDTWKKLMSD